MGFTLEQFKEWVDENFPDNRARAIAEVNFRDGLAKMADFVFETNSTAFIEGKITEITELKEDIDLEVAGISGMTSIVVAKKDAVDASLVVANGLKADMLVIRDQSQAEYQDRGPYNVSTNTPALTVNAAIGQTGAKMQRYIVDVPGNVGFAGSNFASGAALKANDELRQQPNGQWYLWRFTVSAKSIGTTQLSDSGVTLKKTDMFSHGTNFFNILDDENIPGFYIDVPNSNLIASAAYNTTHFMPVTEGQFLTVSIDGVRATTRYAWYNANRTFISGLVTTVTQAAPANAKFVRVSVGTTALTFAKLQVEAALQPSAWQEFEAVLLTSSGSKLVANRSYSSDSAKNLQKDAKLLASQMRYKQGKNLFNIADPDIKAGFYVSYSDGNLIANAAYNTTGFIPVTQLLKYTLSFKNQIAWFNSNRQYIGGSISTDTNKTQTAPENAAYLRCSVATASWALFQVELGEAQTAWEVFGYRISDIDGGIVTADRANKALTADYASAIDPAAKLTGSQIGYTTGKNKFNISASDVSIGFYLLNGALSANVSYNVSGKIPVTPGLVVSLSYKHAISWYKADGTHIATSSQSDTARTQTAPAEAAFLRCTSNVANWALFQVEFGPSPTAFESFRYLVDSIDGVPIYPTHGIDTTVLTGPSIAPIIYVPRGKELAIYIENVVKDYEREGKGRIDIAISGTTGLTMTGRSTKLLTSSVETRTGTVKMYDKNFGLQYTKTFQIKVVSELLTTPLNVMNIGDSYSLRETFINILMASAAGTNINFYGMRNSAQSVPTINHEGRGGWSLATYHVMNTTLFTPFMQPQAPYKYYGNTSYWITAINSPGDYDAGYVTNTIKALYNGTTGILTAPAVNDTMYFNADSAYKKWDGAAWVVVSDLVFTFNFTKYRTLYGTPVIDVIHLLLFTNDFAGVAPADFTAAYTTFKTRMDVTIASFKADNPSIKIILGVGVSSGKQGPDGTWETERRKFAYWMAANGMYTDYGGREAENIYLADYHSTVDRVNGYDPQAILPFNQYTGSERDKFMSDFVHISADGFKQMGNTYMAAIQALR